MLHVDADVVPEAVVLRAKPEWEAVDDFVGSGFDDREHDAFSGEGFHTGEEVFSAYL